MNTHAHTPPEPLSTQDTTRVDDTREWAPQGQFTPSMRAADQADFGPVYAAGQGVIRLLDPDRFLPETAWQLLLSLPREVGP